MSEGYVVVDGSGNVNMTIVGGSELEAMENWVTQYRGIRSGELCDKSIRQQFNTYSGSSQVKKIKVKIT